VINNIKKGQRLKKRDTCLIVEVLANELDWDVVTVKIIDSGYKHDIGKEENWYKTVFSKHDYSLDLDYEVKKL
jgi:hypothetical protein